MKLDENISHSPIIVARKPLSENTVADNVLEWGTGGINIDESRIPTSEDTRRNAKGGENGLGDTSTFKIRERFASDMPKHDGRFPANIIFDEEAGKVLDEQSGISKSSGGNGTKQIIEGQPGLGDSGGASRFFYSPKLEDDELKMNNNNKTDMKLILGDCLDKLKELEDNSVDSIVTDPPYGLSFMGKQWDYDVPSKEIWEECMRVLKPGGHLLAFAGSRTYHRMAVRIEDAGFEIRDMISWIYGSGFPKSMDISKQIDKRAGAEREVIGDGKPMKSLGVMHDDGWESDSNYKITAPATDEAKKWNGWGTALKPAHEPIVMARKPLSENTVADNVLEWGTGGINIDESRIPTSEDTRRNAKGGENGLGDTSTFKIRERFASDMPKHDGRFPANIIFDEEAGKMLDEQTGELKSGFMKAGTPRLMSENPNKNTYGEWKPDTVANDTYGDSGGASRFFYKPENDNINDNIWQQQLNVSTAQRSLYQQEQVEDFVVNLVAIRDNQEDKQLRNMIQPFMNEIQIVLKNNTEKGIKRMISLGQKFVQELQLTITERLKENPVKYVEIQKLINTTMIMQNLLNIDGFVENITSNTILNSMVLGEQDSLTRFKYCPKASRKDRNEGVDDLNNIPKNNSKMWDVDGSGEQYNPNKRDGKGNFHPTVKPTDLMAYLVRLVTPKGGLVLDPFMGSGSTGKAAVREGMNFIGIEREDEYMEIAKSRINYEINKPTKTTKSKVEVSKKVEEKVNQFFG
jgi:DNA modification methylase